MNSNIVSSIFSHKM